MFVRSARYYNYPLRFGYLNRSSSFNAARLQRKYEILRATCPHTVAMVVDAYDVFFHRPASVALRRFHTLNRSVVWSVERFYGHQAASDQAFYDESYLNATNETFGCTRRGVRTLDPRCA